MRLHHRHPWLVAAVTSATMVTGLVLAERVSAEESGLPGMCNGPSTPNIEVHAQAHSGLKYVLNASTDDGSVPEGVLIVGKGAARIYVDQICRVWMHVPGQVPEGGHGGDGEVIDEGATIVHAVGIGHLATGALVLVRTDARATDDGASFRVRYRAMGGGHETAAVMAGESEEEAWTWLPTEGWAPLFQLHVRVGSEVGIT